MRKHSFITGEYYHVYNRGVDKRDIFMNKEDLERFILSIKEFNITKPIGSIRESVKYKNEIWVSKDNKPLVSIVCYTINPNHFHFIIRQEVDGGISEFFKRLLSGYTTYFNKIHERNGVLFQGPFKSHPIKNDQYKLKIIPYANMNHLVHDIPQEKMYLVRSSSTEYDSMNFDIVSKKEAEEIIRFYGSIENFKKECLEIIDIIRSDRGKVSLLEEDKLP